MVPDLTDFDLPVWAKENFLRLFEKYELGPGRITGWDAVQVPGTETLLPHSSLPEPKASVCSADLARLAVCKLNGGLGTSMGCTGPKSLIEVREGHTFLDLIAGQLCEANREYGADLPLVLMNSFFTHEETRKALEPHRGRLRILDFMQNRFPRLRQEDHIPLREEEFGLDAWYPPGHGDLYPCLQHQGLLDQLLGEGREILFVANADNLGATVDPRILHYLLENDIPFLMEMTPKTADDVKGGTLYLDHGKLRLLELAQVPEAHVEEFCGLEKFPAFNTNNLWINLRQLRRRLESGPLDLDVIANRKTVRGMEIVQLETAVGAGLNQFDRAVGLLVSRDRFRPVKKTDDLILIQSDLFVLERGRLVRNPQRKLPGLPSVRLGKFFTRLEDYRSRLPAIPGMLQLKSLNLEGDIRFEENVTLIGHIEIKSRDPMILKQGTVLKDFRVKNQEPGPSR